MTRKTEVLVQGQMEKIIVELPKEIVIFIKENNKKPIGEVLTECIIDRVWTDLDVDQPLRSALIRCYKLREIFENQGFNILDIEGAV